MATSIGTVIDGKYEILKQIGKGGMSVVYLAMDKRLNKQWAVKEVQKNGRGKNGEVVVQSLVAEANMMKRFDHPALPRIVDIIDNGDTIFVIMDYIEGESLDKILEMSGPVDQEIVIEWAKQICDILHYLHTQNPPVVYRDMKPANLMLRPDGTVKIIDFGIAREYKEENIADTKVLGTRGYAAPEQLDKEQQTDPRTDIYGLGATIYHLLTGKSPAKVDMHTKTVRQYNSNIFIGLENIVKKCIEFDPEDRYQSAAELMYALEHYEEEDEIFRKKQKKKLGLFIGAAGLSVLMLISGIGLNVAANAVDKNNYEKLIAGVGSDETVIANCSAAIDIDPGRLEAFERLISVYAESDDVDFNKKEAQALSQKWNEYFNEIGDPSSLDSDERAKYAELRYATGKLYLYAYSEDIDLWGRISKAKADFEAVLLFGQGTEGYATAENFRYLYDFYSKFVVNKKGVNEATIKDYNELLEHIDKCLETANSLEGSDSKYVKLATYAVINYMINLNSQNMVSLGISPDSLKGLLKEVHSYAERTQVNKTISQEMRSEILNHYSEYINSIDREYENYQKFNNVANSSGAEVTP